MRYRTKAPALLPCDAAPVPLKPPLTAAPRVGAFEQAGSDGEKAKFKVPRIFYATRTHSQIAQVRA